MQERFFEHCLLLSIMVAGAPQRLIDTSCFPTTQGGQLDTTIEIITVSAVDILVVDFLLGTVNVNVDMAQPYTETRRPNEYS